MRCSRFQLSNELSCKRGQFLLHVYTKSLTEHRITKVEVMWTSIANMASFVISVLAVAAMKSCATGAAPIVESSCTSISLIVSFHLVSTKRLLVSTKRRRFSETVRSMIFDTDTILGTHVA